MPSKVWIRTLVAIAVVMACGVGTAQATVIDKGHFSGTVTDEPESICGVDVLHSAVFSGSFRVRAPQSGNGQAFLQRLTVKSLDTFVNPLNEKSISISSNELNNELHATQVEGNVYTFETIEAGQAFILRDSDGNVVFKDRGNIRRIVTFDTLGDGRPGGNQLDEAVVRVSGPHPAFDTPDDEFCGIVAGLLS